LLARFSVSSARAPWSADRDEALTIALDYIFAHPDQATGLGLDVDLLEELWR